MKKYMIAAVLLCAVSAFGQAERKYSIGFSVQNGATGSTAHSYFAETEMVTVEIKFGSGEPVLVGTFRVSDMAHVQHTVVEQDVTTTFPALEVRRTITPADVASGVRLQIRSVDGSKARGARGITVYAWGD